MTLDQIRRHFGTFKSASQKLGYHRNTFRHWRTNGVPWNRQLEIERQTLGVLRATK